MPAAAAEMTQKERQGSRDMEGLAVGWADAFKILVAFGGVGAVSAAVAAWIGSLASSRIMQTHKATLDRQIETHKSMLIHDADRNRLLLKRQELMFEREYTAAADYFRFFNGVIPDSWAPDLDWTDAQTRIAEKFGEHENTLRSYLDSHSASLSAEVRKHLVSAKSKANEGCFAVALETSESEYEPGSYPSNTVRTMVDQFYEKLQQAEKRLRIDLQTGSFATINIIAV